MPEAENAQEVHYERLFKKRARHQHTVAVDFDGVLNSYVTRVGLDKQHLLPDPPVPGAREWVEEMVQHFNVIVFTCRAAFPEGLEAVIAWLKRHGFPPLPVTGNKPIAHLYVDDRGFLFTGNNFPSVEFIKNFKTWIGR